MKTGSLPLYERVDRDAEQIDTPYNRWASSQGVDVLHGFYIEDLEALPLKWWERKGGNGILINLKGTGDFDDAFLCNIPPGKGLNPERHLFEELVFILEGRGATTLWQQDGHKQTFEWQKGSLFAIPLNTWYQHFNGEGNREARLLGVTDAPLVFNLFHNEEFIMNNPYPFHDRYQGEVEYFTGKAKLYNDRVLETNFVPDVPSMEAISWNERGKGNATIFFELAEGTMGAHVSEFPVGIYKKAHRHGPGAHVFIIAGEGYSLMWPEGQKRQRFNWRPGSLLVPPENWFHQHFNSGNTPARYLALKMLSRRFKLHPGLINSDVSLKAGGNQIEYEDEDPEIRRTFEAECDTSGATVMLPKR